MIHNDILRPHNQVTRRVRIAASVYIMVAVENIVLQKLHRILILILRRIFVAVLMERKHRTSVDADLIGDIRQQLISGHGLIYLLQPEIVPGHVLGLKQASGLHV